MASLINWYHHKLEGVEFYRLGVMAFMLLIQANVIVPATLLAIAMNSGSTIEFAICATFSFGLLASLLSGASAKITIPLFLVSTVTHLYIIFSNFI